jgi:hypothetical protein
MAGIGHNNPPLPRPVLIMCRDEHGNLDLRWEGETSRARPLPGRDRHGLQRPARDYALERAVAKLNKRKP